MFPTGLLLDWVVAEEESHEDAQSHRGKIVDDAVRHESDGPFARTPPHGTIHSTPAPPRGMRSAGRAARPTIPSIAGRGVFEGVHA
jgi:hypothetical protein